jgi:hypothetical protein
MKTTLLCRSRSLRLRAGSAKLSADEFRSDEDFSAGNGVVRFAAALGESCKTIHIDNPYATAIFSAAR